MLTAVADITQGVLVTRLDGDNVRHGLCADLSFSDADREENIRRVGHVSRLMSEAGLVTLATFVLAMGGRVIQPLLIIFYIDNHQ